ncbi:flagellin N-terminal helical domain-containing protein, partial [Clostridium perfringens]|uniref:flagellin N-terminal helical domain-containing protein n=1 Tax=Clostridium perfringens TaxID=1502 RepID=UPI002ACE75A9
MINHNMNAINAHRNMTNNTNASGKSMEKLSSGLRINRAGDDAAGLSISEKMRGQIRGLDQASRNSQDGISYIQTAEGALTEVSAMLTRMKELAVQAKNGTNNAEDTKNIELEMDTLTQEISNINTNTKFNGKNVFTSAVDITVTQDAVGLLNIGAATLTKTIALNSGSSVGAIEAAIDEVNLQRATYGSQQNRLEHTIN